MVRLSEDGIIIGGSCDKEHHARSVREIGGKWLISECENRKCFERKNGKIRLLRMPKFDIEELWGIGRRNGYDKFSGEYEVGVYRAQDALKTILRMWTTMKNIKEIVEKSCAPVSGFDGMLAMIGMAKPKVQYDSLYQKRKARGDFK